MKRRFLENRIAAIGSTALLLVTMAGYVRADDLAYEVTSSDQFGTIDLTTGQFSEIGNMGVQLSGLGVGPGGALYGGVEGGNTLYQVNPATGSVSPVGSGSFNYLNFGSTTAGLYALDTSDNLYSINPTNGQGTLIGSTGLGGSDGGLSTNSGTLYYESYNTYLYSLNVTTGSPTPIGSSGYPSIGNFGGMVFEDGTLYAGFNDIVAYRVVTVDPTTGVAPTANPETGDFTGSFDGLAPVAVPEPASLSLLGAGGLLLLHRRRSRA
jgi:hypothetical protein